MSTTQQATDRQILQAIDLYEDNAGGLYFHPRGEAWAITMPAAGDFLTDARLFRDSWDETDLPGEAMLDARYLTGPTLDDDGYQVTPQPYTLIASYRYDRDELTVERDRSGEPVAGVAGREYMAASLDPRLSPPPTTTRSLDD